MFKKSLSVLLAAAILLTLLVCIPVSAGAKAVPAAGTGEAGVYDASPYSLWVGGVEVTGTNAANITGSGVSGKISYNASSRTLTLNNATITGTVGKIYYSGGTFYDIDRFGIYSEKSITVKLVGKNTIRIDDSTRNEPQVDAFQDDVRKYGIRVNDGSLTLSGGGSLAVSYKSSYFELTGLYAEDALTIASGTAVSLQITSDEVCGVITGKMVVSGSLNAKTASDGWHDAEGVFASDSLTVAQGGKLIADAQGSCGAVGIGISDGTMTVNGTVSATASPDKDYAYGIRGSGKVIVNEKGVLKAGGGVKALDGVSVVLNSSKLKVFSGDSEASASQTTLAGTDGKKFVRILVPPLKKISACAVTGITAKIYTGKARTQNPVVKYGNTTLKRGTDYTCTYKNNIACGTATLTVTGKGNYTGSVSKAFKIVPAPVTNLKIVNTAAGVRLAWSKSAGAASYPVVVKTKNGWTQIASSKTNGFTYTNVKSGVTYTFAVRAADKTGKYLGAYSAAVSIKFIAAPAKPTLTNTKSGVQVTIKKVTGAEKYRIFRKTGSGKWAKLTDTAALKYVDKTAKNGVTYSYTVRCISKNAKAYTSAYNTVGAKIKCKR